MAKQSVGKRYRGLILFIVVFLLILTGVLFFSYRASSKIDKTTDIIDATGEMSDQSYQMLTNLQSLALNPEAPDIEEKLDNLRSSSDTFGNLLTVLDKGGDYDYGDGDIVTIAPLTSADERQSIDKTEEIWRKYKELINAVLTEQPPSERAKVLSEAAKFSFLVQEDIYDNLDVIYSNQTDISNKTAQDSKQIQLIGLGLIALFFGLFMLYFIRQLRAADKKTFIAQEETANILKTVNEGLFLLDKEQKIGSQTSRELGKILGRDNLQGITFDNMLASIVSKKDLETAQDYVEQLYNPKVKEKLIQDLNPLDEVQASIVNEQGHVVDRYLKFNFNRVYGENEKEIESVLVSIVDNSRAVELEKHLAVEKVHNEQQVETLASVLKSDSHMIQQFINSTESRIEKINETLRKPDLSHNELRGKVKSIYREVHALKGESSALGLSKVVKVAHDAEEELQLLRNKRQLSGNDFLPLAVIFEKIIDAVDSIKEVNTMLTARGGVANTGRSVAQDSSDSILVSEQQYFDRAVHDIALREQKLVQFNGFGIQEHLLHKRKYKQVKDIAIQLIRNAVVHGIESPDQRVRAGKPKTGQIKMTFMQNTADKVVLRITDDGAGIDFDKIRNQLTLAGIYEEEEARALSQKELLKEIFQSGLSTAEQVSEDAGRGVGLDIVVEHVKTLGGHLSVNSEPGKFTRFTLTYPI